MPTELIKLGSEAERVVCVHLEKLGYIILDRNWRRPWGELDVVAERDGVVHFVEVKASRQVVNGFDPFLRADGWKMHKVRRTAQTWLSVHRYSHDTEWQMDIASVIMTPDAPRIELFENV